MKQLTHIPIFGFRGDNEDHNILTLPDVYSSKDSSNVYVDVEGRIRKAKGYTKANSSAITANTSGDAVKVVSLHNYNSYSGGTKTTTVLAFVTDETNEFECWKSTDGGANWTFVLDLGSSYINEKPRASQFDTKLYIAFGTGDVYTWDGTTLAALSNDQSPTPTATATGNGPLTGSYRWKLVARKDDFSRKLASAASDETVCDFEDCDLSWTADSDVTVVGYEVYRTTGTGEYFRFIAYVDGRTTTSFTDTKADAYQLGQRTLEEYGLKPESGVHYVETWQERNWYANTDTYPRRVWYSDPQLPYSTNTDTSWFELTDGTSASDVITGMFDLRGALMVGMERSVWLISGTGRLVNGVPDWYPAKTQAVFGPVSQESMVRVPAGALFPTSNGGIEQIPETSVAYFTSNLDVRIFNGDTDTIISRVKKQFLDDVNFANRGSVHAIHNAVDGHIHWYVPHGSGQTTPNKALLWDYRHGVMTELDTRPFSCSVVTESSTETQIILCGEPLKATGGYVYTEWSGYDHDGTDITADFWTKPIVGIEMGQLGGGFPIPHKLKRWIEFYPVLKVVSGAREVHFEWYPGWATANEDMAGDTTYQTGTRPYQTHHQPRLLMKNAVGNYLTSTAMRLRVRETSSSEGFGFPGFTLGFQALDTTHGLPYKNGEML